MSKEVEVTRSGKLVYSCSEPSNAWNYIEKQSDKVDPDSKYCVWDWR